MNSSRSSWCLTRFIVCHEFQLSLEPQEKARERSPSVTLTVELEALAHFTLPHCNLITE